MIITCQVMTKHNNPGYTLGCMGTTILYPENIIGQIKIVIRQRRRMALII